MDRRGHSHDGARTVETVGERFRPAISAPSAHGPQARTHMMWRAPGGALRKGSVEYREPGDHPAGWFFKRAALSPTRAFSALTPNPGHAWQEVLECACGRGEVPRHTTGFDLSVRKHDRVRR